MNHLDRPPITPKHLIDKQVIVSLMNGGKAFGKLSGIDKANNIILEQGFIQREEFRTKDSTKMFIRGSQISFMEEK